MSGFRFLTLALAASPFLPIVAYQTDDGWTALSWIQVMRLHLDHSAQAHPGMFALLVPPVLGAVSLLVPAGRVGARRALALVAVAVATFELGLVLIPGGQGLAAWFALDALIPAARFGRHAMMMLFLTVLWAYMELRPPPEDDGANAG